MKKIPLDRKVEYIYRGVGYAIIIAIVGVFHFSQNPILHGALSGVLLGDYVTWFGRSLLRLQEHLSDFAIDALCGIVAGVVMFGLFGVRIPNDPDGLAVGMLAFMTVIMVKVSLFMVDDGDRQ